MRRLPDALQLVWHAGRRWTALWAILLVVQGLLPVGTVLLSRPLMNDALEAIRTWAGGDEPHHGRGPSQSEARPASAAERGDGDGDLDIDGRRVSGACGWEHPAVGACGVRSEEERGGGDDDGADEMKTGGFTQSRGSNASHVPKIFAPLRILPE